MLEELEEEFGMGPERTVHAKFNGGEVVRYDDEWFIEPIKVRPTSDYYRKPVEEKESKEEKRQVTMEEAAKIAAEKVRRDWEPRNKVWPKGGFRIYWEQEGGEEFEAIVKELCPMLDTRLQYVDLGDGHEFMGMPCPGCGEILHIVRAQVGADTCTYHAQSDGGCGFHGYVVGDNAGYVCELGTVLTEKRKKEAAEKAVKQKVKA